MTENNQKKFYGKGQIVLNLAFPLTVLTVSRLKNYERTKNSKVSGFAEAFIILSALATDAWTGYEAFINYSSDKAILMYRLTLMGIAASTPN